MKPPDLYVRIIGKALMFPLYLTLWLHERWRMNRIIAGALYDFIGFLTTRKELLRVGASEQCPPIMELFTEWAESRGLDIDDADVKHWHDCLPAPEAAP